MTEEMDSAQLELMEMLEALGPPTTPEAIPMPETPGRPSPLSSATQTQTTSLSRHATNPQVWRIAKWLQNEPLEELAGRLTQTLERVAPRIELIQKVLLRRIPDTVDDQRRMYLDLDAHHYFISSLLAESDALLDKADMVALPPCGTSVPCIDQTTGLEVPATGCKVTDPNDPDFRPKMKELTETDRTTIQKAQGAAFRRFRDEIKALAEGVQNRLFNIKGLVRLEGGS